MRQASKTEEVDGPAGVVGDSFQDLLELGIVEEILGGIVVSDAAAGDGLLEGGVEQRVTVRPAGDGARLGGRDDLAAPAGFTLGGDPHGLSLLVDVGLVDAAAVIPEHGQVAIRRVGLDAPGEEGAGHGRIPGIGGAETLHLVGLKRGPLLR